MGLSAERVRMLKEFEMQAVRQALPSLGIIKDRSGVGYIRHLDGSLERLDSKAEKINKRSRRRERNDRERYIGAI